MDLGPRRPRGRATGQQSSRGPPPPALTLAPILLCPVLPARGPCHFQCPGGRLHPSLVPAGARRGKAGSWALALSAAKRSWGVPPAPRTSGGRSGRHGPSSTAAPLPTACPPATGPCCSLRPSGRPGTASSPGAWFCGAGQAGHTRGCVIERGSLGAAARRGPGWGLSFQILGPSRRRPSRPLPGSRPGEQRARGGHSLPPRPGPATAPVHAGI